MREQQTKVWVPEEQISAAVAAVPGEAFTLLDFVRVFSELYPELWSDLFVAFGEKGDGRGRNYTAAVYLGNRLWMLSKKPGSPLLPLLPWKKGGVETPNQRRATPAERALGAEGIIRVFRKRPA
ncbi:MAG TPA: hypothetical protein VNT75_17475 [Symbiobacteriaceae bacterium]|nr:hypothetical protein [Symbiobacteriaceae bacterium]